MMEVIAYSCYFPVRASDLFERKSKSARLSVLNSSHPPSLDDTFINRKVFDVSCLWHDGLSTTDQRNSDKCRQPHPLKMYSEGRAHPCQKMKVFRGLNPGSLIIAGPWPFRFPYRLLHLQAESLNRLPPLPADVLRAFALSIRDAGSRAGMPSIFRIPVKNARSVPGRGSHFRMTESRFPIMNFPLPVLISRISGQAGKVFHHLCDFP